MPEEQTHTELLNLALENSDSNIVFLSSYSSSPSSSPPPSSPTLPQREVIGRIQRAFVLEMSGKIKEGDQRGDEGSRRGREVGVRRKGATGSVEKMGEREQ